MPWIKYLIDMSFLAALPIVGGAVSSLFQPVASLFGADDVSKTNRSNERIADMNIQMQRETNKINRQNVLDTNKSNQEIARQYNANQVELQNDMNVFNKEMWDLNNQYNSPVQQLARAELAGINPNIVFGQPVASSPVQQTSIPSQQMARMEAYQERAPHNDMRYENARTLEKLGDALRGISKLPFVKQELESRQEDLKSKRLDNDLKEFEKWEREEEKKQFDNFSFVRSRDGQSLISPDEYFGLSDVEKRRFLEPKYRHLISDKLISESDYNGLSEDNKKHYVVDYGDISARLPEFVKSPFKSRRQFESYKSLYSVGATLSNIRADRLQNNLRELVYSGQISDSNAVNAMIKMPEFEFKKLVQEYKKVIEDVKTARENNKGLAARLATQDKIASYTASKMENDSRRDVIGIIKQYVPEGSIRDFLISAYAIFKDLR